MKNKLLLLVFICCLTATVPQLFPAVNVTVKNCTDTQLDCYQIWTNILGYQSQGPEVRISSKKPFTFKQSLRPIDEISCRWKSANDIVDYPYSTPSKKEGGHDNWNIFFRGYLMEGTQCPKK
jgi:hypothetical protein